MLKDRSYYGVERATNRKIAGPKPFALPPPSLRDRIKLVAPPTVQRSKNWLRPHPFSMPNIQVPGIKTSSNLFVVP